MAKIISTDKAPRAAGPYSQGMLTGGILFVSGQLPVDPTLGCPVDGIEAQAVRCCENVGEILHAAGMSFENVVKTTCFLSDMEYFGKFNEIYEKYFVSKPARSCVAVKEIPKGVLCEIEAIAAINTFGGCKDA